jgi:hypothetical protein
VFSYSIRHSAMLGCSFHLWHWLLHVDTIALHLEGIALQANNRRKCDARVNRSFEAMIDKSFLKKS